MSPSPPEKTPAGSVASQEAEEVDPLEAMLNKTGCKKPHYALQDCMFENKDWRKCQPLVNELRDCMLEYTLRKEEAEKAKQ